MIPLVDLKAQYKTIKKEILSKVQEVLESCAFIQGKYVEDFETQYADLLNAKYCIGCSSGTSALFLGLKALGIGAGDEVITTPFTFTATAEAICNTEAKPVFVDIDPDTYNIDVSKIEKVITKKTKAIVPVHLYGNPVNMLLLIQIAKNYNLKVVEDCAQAHLATYRNKAVGTFGDIGAFSFYPGKNLGAYGDAGAVITNDKSLADRMRKLADHGRVQKYYHEIVGYNFRLDAVQAAVLIVKLKHICGWTKKRQRNAELYNNFLKENRQIKIPKAQDDGKHVYHLYVVQVSNRDKTINYLRKKGIMASIHYPLPLHLQKAFKFLGYKKGDLPVSEEVSKKVMSLPMYPELDERKIKFICDSLNGF